MSRLLLDTFLILLGSFFLGCIVACMFRRAFFGGARQTAAPIGASDDAASTMTPAPATQLPPAATAQSARFERALGDVAPPRPAPTPGQTPMIEVDPVAPKLAQATVAAKPVGPPAAAVPAKAPGPVVAAAALTGAAAAAEAARFDRALTGAPDGAATTPPRSAPAVQSAPPATPAPPPPPAAAQAARPAAPATPTAPAAATSQQQAAAVATIAAIAAAAGGAQPKAAPAQTAPAKAATSPDELARLIAFSNQPAPTKPKPAAPPTGTPVAAIAATAAAEQAATSGDDLKRIRAIDAELEARLSRLGVRRFADIAAWTSNDVVRMSQSLGFAGRIEQENWIEQAQILAKGADTEFSKRQSAAEEKPPVSITSLPTGGDQTTIAAIAAAAVAAASSPQKKAAPAPSTPAQVAAAAAQAFGGDRLHRILGVNAEAERILHENGVTRFAQIAAWSSSDADRFDQLLGKPGRVDRENWIEQAKLLAQASDSTDALVSASATATTTTTGVQDNTPRVGRSDVGTLRSVRSEALRGQAPANDAGRPSVLTRSIGFSDDLKRIRGVGVLIEKKLNSLGVTNYEQVANWTGADIDRISQILDFKGRIERENWIEQARILAAGGQTEFSRRVDRGEVDSSKPTR